jgi:glucokinase
MDVFARSPPWMALPAVLRGDSLPPWLRRRIQKQSLYQELFHCRIIYNFKLLIVILQALFTMAEASRMSVKHFVVWDLGGTKCAAALVQYNPHNQEFSCLKRHYLKLLECESLNQLIENIEAHLGLKMSDADGICIGAAGQFDGRVLNLEKGYPFEMNFAEIAQQKGWKNWQVVHDYVPILCTTFTSYMNNSENVRILVPGHEDPFGRRVVFGVGTGLGLKDGVLSKGGELWLGTNEIGLIGIPHPPLVDKAVRDRHREFIHFLRSDKAFGDDKPITFEAILTGQGTRRLHQFLTGEANLSPEALGEQLRNGWHQPTLKLFAWYLGLFVGTVQLIFMPSGGIWITGGVVLRHLESVDQPEFLLGIQASPAYATERAQFPLGVLANSDHAFYGGAYYALRSLNSHNKAHTCT